MSYNNHDKDDPNVVKYSKSPTELQLKNVNTLLEMEDDGNYELMQVMLMAKAMKYNQWKEWLSKNWITITFKK